MGLALISSVYPYVPGMTSTFLNNKDLEQKRTNKFEQIKFNLSSNGFHQNYLANFVATPQFKNLTINITRAQQITK